mmetsp:Transcript_22226/g.25735  ORF Transcript_22226/g.25735 Transcript_22226/m.25735 type:complete len:851 (-) Transcript_22226:97-2649(-)
MSLLSTKHDVYSPFKIATPESSTTFFITNMETTINNCEKDNNKNIGMTESKLELEGEEEGTGVFLAPTLSDDVIKSTDANTSTSVLHPTHHQYYNAFKHSSNNNNKEITPCNPVQNSSSNNSCNELKIMSNTPRTSSASTFLSKGTGGAVGGDEPLQFDFDTRCPSHTSLTQTQTSSCSFQHLSSDKSLELDMDETVLLDLSQQHNVEEHDKSNIFKEEESRSDGDNVNSSKTTPTTTKTTCSDVCETDTAIKLPQQQQKMNTKSITNLINNKSNNNNTTTATSCSPPSYTHSKFIVPEMYTKKRPNNKNHQMLSTRKVQPIVYSAIGSLEHVNQHSFGSFNHKVYIASSKKKLKEQQKQLQQPLEFDSKTSQINQRPSEIEKEQAAAAARLEKKIQNQLSKKKNKEKNRVLLAGKGDTEGDDDVDDSLYYNKKDTSKFNNQDGKNGKLDHRSALVNSDLDASAETSHLAEKVIQKSLLATTDLDSNNDDKNSQESSESDHLKSAPTNNLILTSQIIPKATVKTSENQIMQPKKKLSSNLKKGKKKKDKKKKVTINEQTRDIRHVELFRPSCDAYTPRMGRKEIKFKPAAERAGMESMSTTMGTIQKPNFRDALRRVAMIIQQHIVKIERRFEAGANHMGLFTPAMRDAFAEENFVTPRYKYSMVNLPMGRAGVVYGMRKIRNEYKIPTADDIYEFAHRLFKQVQLSSECSIICLIYVERLMENAKVPVMAKTWRPIMMCGLLLASKVWQDWASWNIEFASVYPQFSLDAINKLELKFCTMVKWDLFISSSLYAKYYFALRSLLEKQDFRRRYVRMVGGVDNVSASEAMMISKRSEMMKEKALSHLSMSM